MCNFNIPAIKSFIKYFTSWQIEEVGKDTGFTKRNDGKLLSITFLRVFTIGLWSSQNATMNHIVQHCEDLQEGLSITKQAVHKRLGAGVELLKKMFDMSMEYSMRYSSTSNMSDALSQFENVIVCDSTYITLPNKLKQYFRGFGGKGKNESSLKVQAEYSVITRSFTNLVIAEGTDNDQSHLKNLLETIKKNQLLIHDMGYFSFKFLKEMNKKGAYYITRLPSHIAFFPDMEVAKDKSLLLETILDTTKAIVDKQVFIGGERNKRISARLVAIRVPANVADERIRKASKKAQSRGKTLTKRQKLLLAWNIIITNVQCEKLSAEMAIDLYKIRWQIEIIFKAWKSHLRLENIAHGGKNQVECLLYGRLIVITMMTAIYSRFYSLMLTKKHRELSILKFFSLVTLKARDIARIICYGMKHASDLLAVFLNIARKSIYEKRNRRTTLELIFSHNPPVLENCG